MSRLTDRLGPGFARPHLLPLAVVLVTALAATAGFLAGRPANVLPFDDSYISLSYAHNIAVNGSYTFGVDAPTEGYGTTSPLHVILLALAIAATRWFAGEVHTSLAVGVLSHAALGWAVYWLGVVAFRNRAIALLGSIATVATGYAVYDALNGLETTLFLTLSVAAVAHVLMDEEGRRPVMTGVLLTMCVLARPEGALLTVALLLFDAQRRVAGRRPLWPHFGLWLLPMLVGGIAYLVFGLAVSGQPFPSTGLTKLRYFREYTLDIGTKLQFARDAVFDFYGPLVLVIPLAVLTIRTQAARVLVLYLTVFFLLYVLLFPGGLGHYWYRYQHIVLPFLALHAVAGLHIADRLLRRAGLDFRLLLVGVAVGAFLFQLISHYDSMRARYHEDLAFTQNAGLQVAQWLRDSTPEGSVVATHDIGIPGYYSERPILDLVGLVNREVVGRHSTRSVRSYLLDKRPDYLLILPFHDDLFLNVRPDEDPSVFQFVKEFEPIRGGHRFRLYMLAAGPT